MSDKITEKVAVVLLNLGGPDSLDAVKPFLYNLFSDREIIKLGPPFLQKPIARMISGLRAGKTKNMYRQIGGKSPILDITLDQARALEEALNVTVEGVSGAPESGYAGIDSHRGSPPEGGGRISYRVYVGMRYWHPFITDTVQKILEERFDRVIAVSLYPHYSRATTGSATSEFRRAIKGAGIGVKYVTQWYDDVTYIDALADTIYSGISEFGAVGQAGELVDSVSVLYSAHSLPESFIREGDPYLDHINATVRKVHERLSLAPYGITGFKWQLSFQSKTGPVKWLQPSTDETIIRLAESGIKDVLVVPVSFVSDHIETLYEIDILYKGLAAKHGMNLRRCRSLNISEKFINALKALVVREAQGTAEA